MAQAPNDVAAEKTRTSSRRRVIDATIETIVEVGYYQATSNEIARRAGVTWGVIQYYFGSRERLLVAVIEDACAQTIEDLKQTEIVGDTLVDRLESWVDTVYSYFSQPGYVAVLQILWDVLRRPGTAAESKATMLKYQADVQASFHALLPQVSEGPPELAGLVHAAAWGLSVARASAVYCDVFPEAADVPRREFVEALAWLIERAAPEVPVDEAEQSS